LGLLGGMSEISGVVIVGIELESIALNLRDLIIKFDIGSIMILGFLVFPIGCGLKFNPILLLLFLDRFILRQ
jgi:hypothetical protein